MRDTCDLMLRSAHRALQTMDKITISDLEVFYRVGVPEEERAEPQRLLPHDRNAFRLHRRRFTR
jgi:hypothetical protein